MYQMFFNGQYQKPGWIHDTVCPCGWPSFKRQCTFWNEVHQKGQFGMSASQAERFLEPESQTLEHCYWPCHNDASLIIDSHQNQNENIQQMLQWCCDVGNCNFTSTQLQEEQERELSPEIEQEWQVQKPTEAEPKIHTIHTDLLSFASTGLFKKDSDAFKLAFMTLRNTSAASYLNMFQFPSELCVTHDFVTTVKTLKVSSFISDAYQQPVQWILTSCCDCSWSSNRCVAENVAIISPYEANHLLPKIWESGAVTLHIYVPRQNPAYPSLDKLTLYNVSAATTTASIEFPDDIRIQPDLLPVSFTSDPTSSINSYATFWGWLTVVQHLRVWLWQTTALFWETMIRQCSVKARWNFWRLSCPRFEKTARWLTRRMLARYWVVSFCTHLIFSLQWKYRGNEPAAKYIYIYIYIFCYI